MSRSHGEPTFVSMSHGLPTIMMYAASRCVPRSHNDPTFVSRSHGQPTIVAQSHSEPSTVHKVTPKAYLCFKITQAYICDKVTWLGYISVMVK